MKKKDLLLMHDVKLIKNQVNNYFNQIHYMNNDETIRNEIDKYFYQMYNLNDDEMKQN